jgi:hypothetical protein
MRNPLILNLALAATLAGGVALPTAAAAQPAHAWEIGPRERGRNFSAGMASTPRPAPRGWYFDFFYPSPRAGHVNYVTTPTGPLLGKRKIVLHYRIDAAPGVRLAPRENPRAPARLSLYFQRRGDNWSGRGRFEHYRWYAMPAHRLPLTPGEHRIELALDGRNWKSIQSSSGAKAPAQFRDALANASRVGFVLGGGGSAGHGVFATGPARFTLLNFRVI